MHYLWGSKVRSKLSPVEISFSLPTSPSSSHAVITPAFNAAFKPEVQERAWRDGGVYPFLRIPEALTKRAELLAAKRAEATGAAAATPAAELGMAGRRR